MLPKIDTPTFKCEIPSTKQIITMRCMKVRDEKILLMAKQGGEATEILSAIKQVVDTCLVDNVDTNALALFDLEYMFLQLRANSVSDVVEVSYIDNDEVASDMSEVDTSTVEASQVNKMYEAARKKATRTFQIDLKKVKVVFPNAERTIKLGTGFGLVLKYPPASLYSDREFLNADPESLAYFLISNSIEKVYKGEEEWSPADISDNELVEWLEDLPPKSYQEIEEFFANLPHLEHKITYTNRNGKEREIVLSTLNDFFQFA